MHSRQLLATVASLLVHGCATVASRDTRPGAPSEAEHAETIGALKPPKRTRPVVAVLGENRGAETTDYLVPYAVLWQSGLADVWALATEPGPLKLVPALTIRPQATTAEFDARYPEGADYVIVPAMHETDAPAVLAFIKAQAAKGATIVGVCSGVKVLANAALLDGRAATGHWYDLDELREDHPTMRWVRDRRYVADRGVVTTTGISASIPASLAIVEAIGGRDRAKKLAQELGVTGWDEAHDSDAFRLGGHLWTAVGNTLAFWNHETIGLTLEGRVDDIALAFTADAYSRTYRSKVETIAASDAPLITLRGIEVLPDRVGTDAGMAAQLPPVSPVEPARALDLALEGIAERYGQRTAAFVALQLEYPWSRPER
jgi:putative intracellular protease/amidase